MGRLCTGVWSGVGETGGRMTGSPCALPTSRRRERLRHPRLKLSAAKNLDAIARLRLRVAYESIANRTIRAVLGDPTALPR